MDTNTFYENLRQNPRPVIVDLWAPWCGPCRAVKPVLEKLAQDYDGRVDLWQVNADESQELLRELGVFSIPTLIAYNGDKEIARYVGAKHAGELNALFDSMARGVAPAPSGLSVPDRFLRITVGLVFLGFGLANGVNWFMLAIAAGFLFSAVHDRCPIWKAVKGQFKKIAAR